MQNFYLCPICMGIPEREIFQCSAGHVICHSCISKVNGNLCPQCRVPFGTPKIRNRVLEQILDSQHFECQFKDNGCANLFKCAELTEHANSCVNNPDTIPLCYQMELGDCGDKSKAEVIAHFTDVHNISVVSHPTLSCWVAGKVYLTAQLDPFVIPNTGFGVIVSSNSTDSSPLFLIHGKMYPQTRYWSLKCIKIWNSDSQPNAKYVASFTFIKSSLTQETYSTNSPFPFGGALAVCGIKKSLGIIDASPINIPHSILEHNGFGSSSFDSLQISINLCLLNGRH